MCQPNSLGLFSGVSDPSHQLATRGSTVSTVSSVSKPSSAFVSLAGLISDSPSAKEAAQNVPHKIQVSNTGLQCFFSIPFYFFCIDYTVFRYCLILPMKILNI